MFAFARSAASRIFPIASITGCAVRAATGVHSSLSGSMVSALDGIVSGKSLTRILTLISSCPADTSDVPAPLPTAPSLPTRTV